MTRRSATAASGASFGPAGEDRASSRSFSFDISQHPSATSNQTDESSLDANSPMSTCQCVRSQILLRIRSFPAGILGRKSRRLSPSQILGPLQESSQRLRLLSLITPEDMMDRHAKRACATHQNANSSSANHRSKLPQSAIPRKGYVEHTVRARSAKRKFAQQVTLSRKVHSWPCS